MNKLKTPLIILLAVLAIVAYDGIYVVNEGERALALRLGEIVTDREGNPKISAPGLHFKIPFLVQIRKLDVRLKMLEVDSSRVLTTEQKDVLVDYYAEWRIVDEIRFYNRSNRGSDIRAETLLAQGLNNNLREEFGKRNIREVVSDRGEVIQILRQQAQRNARELGIEVMDVRIRRIDLPDEVSASVFDRMRTERFRVARNLRATGEARANEIQANADREQVVILAEAEKRAQEVRAIGDAEAANIYAKAYQQDPEFYAFYRSLDAYRNSFEDGNDLLVLQPEGQFFNYFNNMQGKASAN